MCLSPAARLDGELCDQISWTAINAASHEQLNEPSRISNYPHSKLDLPIPFIRPPLKAPEPPIPLYQHGLILHDHACSSFNRTRSVQKRKYRCSVQGREYGNINQYLLVGPTSGRLASERGWCEERKNNDMHANPLNPTKTPRHKVPQVRTWKQDGEKGGIWNENEAGNLGTDAWLRCSRL